MPSVNSYSDSQVSALLSALTKHTLAMQAQTQAINAMCEAIADLLDSQIEEDNGEQQTVGINGKPF